MLHDFAANTGERNGPVVLSLMLLSFLEGRVTLGVRQSSGTSHVASDLRNIIRRRGAMSSASSLSSRGPRLPGPGDLFGLRSFSSFVIPFNVMLMLSNTGNWLSTVGILYT